MAKKKQLAGKTTKLARLPLTQALAEQSEEAQYRGGPVVKASDSGDPGDALIYLTSLTPSPRRGRRSYRTFYKFITMVTTALVMLVILALSTFFIYRGFGGKAVQQISQGLRRLLPSSFNAADRLVGSRPKKFPERELVPDRANLLKPEKQQEASSRPPNKGHPPPADITSVAPPPSQESLASEPKPSPIEIKRGDNLASIIAEYYPEDEKLGLVAIILANPEIHDKNLLLEGQILKLPRVSYDDEIIQLEDNLFYILYGSYYTNVNFENHTSGLINKKVRFLVRNTKDSKKKRVQWIILGGYETKDQLAKAFQSSKNNYK